MVRFPDPESADSFGLVACGGDLDPATLVEAYSRGIFPYTEDGTDLFWLSPDPRAIFELDRFHVSRRLARTMRSGRFQVTINKNFGQVMRGCADRPEGTWITRDMIRAYEKLHRLNLAHSVETWSEGQLVGGVYGVALRGLFAGESMFHRENDASKVALACLVEHLRSRGMVLFDVQWLNGHTASLGALEISRKEYLQRLRKALLKKVSFADRIVG